MKRLSLALLAVFTITLALAGCGGHASRPTAVLPQSATGSVHPPGWGSTPKGFVLPAPLPTAVPTGEMFDTITLSTVPARPFALAGYTSGSWPTYLPLRAAYPAAHTISIAVNASHHAACLDVEPGDAVPSQAGAWVRADIAAGFPRPCIYSDLSNMPAVRASLAGIPRSRYLLWLAWYRFTPGLIAGYDAVQWTDRALGRNLDESTVTLDFLKIAQPPYVAPNPNPVCFSHRIPAGSCASARAQVASAARAVASSQRAYTARGCPVLAQRIGWFSSRLKSQPRVKTAYRTGALAASRRAYTRQGCPIFTGRIRGNQAAIRKVEAAN